MVEDEEDDEDVTVVEMNAPAALRMIDQRPLPEIKLLNLNKKCFKISCANFKVSLQLVISYVSIL
jgi:ubiquinone biosynthesis protein UbiJ